MTGLILPAMARKWPPMYKRAQDIEAFTGKTGRLTCAACLEGDKKSVQTLNLRYLFPVVKILQYNLVPGWDIITPTPPSFIL